MNIIATGIAFYFLDIITLVFSSFLLAYVLSPIYEKLVKIGFSRFLSALLSVFIAAILLVLLLIYSVPKLYMQAIELFKFLQLVYRLVIDKYAHILDDYGQQPLSNMLLSKDSLQKAVVVASGYGYDLVNLVLQFISVIMMCFYMLKDWELWRPRFLSIVPEQYKSTANILFEDIMHSLKIWIYGQMLVTLTLFAYYFMALSYINMPFAFLLSCLFSILSIIPYIGDMISFIIMFSILSGYQPFFSEFMIYSFAILSLGFVLENVFMVQLFIGRKAGIHPLFLFILLLIFGKLLGISGIILTLPLSVIFAAVWRTGIIKRKWS
ncbi:AI-2E family transporter [Candidatus Cytomitobacter indipagum]|uniref:AI-2E family transporter n=1 Tax=Candidatus Cytomitobacter indipagum TaxID=2601575 RepID=A0A5C0UEU9_9PROT|nr:AI-2E family transporter [Candidatus Cytomitobacter indipagum]QEK38211.1 AI-2E family transporter [Candidatus Cytomitobacter indipagum]